MSHVTFRADALVAQMAKLEKDLTGLRVVPGLEEPARYAILRALIRLETAVQAAVIELTPQADTEPPPPPPNLIVDEIFDQSIMNKKP